MNEIKCPKCGTVFTVDEADYASIVSQVRTEEFKKDLEAQKKLLEEARRNDIDLAVAKANAVNEKIIAELNTKFAAEKVSYEKKIADEIQKSELALARAAEDKSKAVNAAEKNKDAELEQLRDEIRKIREEKTRSEATLKGEKEREISELKHKLESAESEKAAAVEKVTIEKTGEITLLNEKLAQAAKDSRTAVDNAVSEKEKEIIRLSGELEHEKQDRALCEQRINENHEKQLKLKDDEIERIKDFKAKQSTKMIGESLEQHCKQEFDRVRALLPSGVYFEKDNDAVDGTKGDFIYRETEDGIEFVSIMFEMKNESASDGKKHKNDDFFAKLDSDRKKKNCEYAVLVSLLEPDSEYYNDGIVTVYQYEKMFVVRPQFFLSILMLIRNISKNTLGYRKELNESRMLHVDISNFEKELGDFKQGFNDSCDLTRKSFNEAMKNIDKSINDLLETKEKLRLTIKHLTEADNKVQGITIRKLTKNSPALKSAFAELREGKEPETIEGTNW